MFKVEIIMILLTLLFMVFDIITGFTVCLKNKNFSSSKMRKGIFNKAGLILLIVFAIILDYSQIFFDVSAIIRSIGLPFDTIPMVNAIGIYIITMECGSIKENISKVNKNIKFFKKE